jgi:proteasome assembly chaperone (PAC2) family protein
MHEAPPSDVLRIERVPAVQGAVLVLALSGWMDGGDVSTGTVERLVDLLEATPFAEIDSEPFYLFSFPGSMELTALFRPHVRMENGLVVKHEMPTNRFFAHEPANLLLFVGKEPNLRWRGYCDALLELARKANVKRIVFIGSFGGSVPHTREPRLFVTCSRAELLPEMKRLGLRTRDVYEGPGSLTTYLLTRVSEAKLEMISLVAEIPGYLQGRNPSCIEAVTRRLAKMLKLPLDLHGLREESTAWELAVSQAMEDDKKLAKTIRSLEEAYDDELIAREEGNDENEPEA